MSKSLAFEEVVERFLECYREGECPDITTFTQRYPKFRTKLEKLLPLILKMEGYAEEKHPKQEDTWEAFPDLKNTDYQLIRKIGSGGMGAVYEAQQCSLNRKVAIKVLASASVEDVQQRALLENEARVIAMLYHPNIVKIFSAEISSEQCYYAMEYIQGESVNHVTFSDLRKVAEIGLQTAKALAYAHSCNVLHRDIKPANLLLDAQGDVHVSDFGLAFIVQSPTGLQEGLHARHGTIRYMAPERIEHGLNTFAGDQYSFGVTLYEMVTQQPFLVEHSTKALMERIRKGNLPILKCAEPDLAAIINKCIAFRQEDRYPSMDTVVEDLQRFLNHEVVSAASTSWLRRITLWIKRKPAVASLSLLGVCLFFAFVVALVVGTIRGNLARELTETNAEYRFQYARLLGRQAPPRTQRNPESVTDAITLLNDLVVEYPDRPEYGIALLETMSRKLRHAQPLSEAEGASLTLALSTAYHLLERFPNTTGVIQSVLAFHRSYVIYHHRTGDRATAQKEIEHLQTTLETLAQKPELSETIQQLLQTFQEERSHRQRPPFPNKKIPSHYRKNGPPDGGSLRR